MALSSRIRSSKLFKDARKINITNQIFQYFLHQIRFTRFYWDFFISNKLYYFKVEKTISNNAHKCSTIHL